MKQALALAVIGLLGTAILLIVAWTWYNGIGPTPSSTKAKKSLLAMIPANFSGVIYELGSGWGTLAFALAKRYPHCQVVAYENSVVPLLYSRLYHVFYRYDNLKFIWKNFFDAPLCEADLVVCYLYPGAMRALKPVFEQHLKDGAWVLTHTFAVPTWQPVRISKVEDLYQTKIYLYQFDKIKMRI